MFVVYVGNIPGTVTDETLRAELGAHAEVREIERNFKRASAMVKYDSMEDAAIAVERYNNMELNDSKIVVENPRPAKARGHGKPPIRFDLRVLIKGLTPETSWQDLKDWARQSLDGVEVVYSNVFDLDGVHCGLVEYKVTSTSSYLYGR